MSCRPEDRCNNKPGWYKQHIQSANRAIKERAEVVLLGDSLVANLSRYPCVYDQHLSPLNTVNCGIGGDRAQNVLWRVGNLRLPTTVSVGIIAVGINDIMIKDSQPFAFGAREIADNVISCARELKVRHPWMSIILSAILPTDTALEGWKALIEEVNLHLKVASCLLYTSPSPRDLSTSRMPSSA